MNLSLKPGLRAAFAAIALILGSITLLSISAYGAEGTVSTSPDQTVAEDESSWREKVYSGDSQGLSPALLSSDSGPTLFGIISRIIVFLIIVTAIALGVVHYARKGKINLNALKPYSSSSGGQLIISETRMLGNKQYLLVIEHDEQKMLIGVSPGRIEHLCFLDVPYEDNRQAAGLSENLGEA